MFTKLSRTCRACRRGLWDYAQNNISEELLEKIENHLPKCASCRRELEALRRAQMLLATCRQESVPEPQTGWNALRQRIEEQGAAPMPTRSHGASAPVHYAAARMRPEKLFRRTFRIRQDNWLFGATYAGGLATFLLAAALGYRLWMPIGQAQRVPAHSAGVQGAARSTTEKASTPATQTVANRNTAHEKRSASSSENAPSAPAYADPNDASDYRPIFVPVVSHSTDQQETAQAVRHEPQRKSANALRMLAKNAESPRQSKQPKANSTQMAQNEPLRFVPHHPRPDEQAPEQADNSGRRYLLDQITPVSNTHPSDASDSGTKFNAETAY